MQLNYQKKPLPTKPSKLTDVGEKERLLALMGIFPNQAREFGETLKRRAIRPQRNYSK